MRNARLAEFIPDYPKGVSEEYLAIKAGYMKAPFTEKRVARGLARLRRDLMWLTLRDPGLTHRCEKLQVSTRKHLMDEGFPIEGKVMYTYLSRLRGNG